MRCCDGMASLEGRLAGAGYCGRSDGGSGTDAIPYSVCVVPAGESEGEKEGMLRRRDFLGVTALLDVF